jgi:hypothetical protein
MGDDLAFGGGKSPGMTINPERAFGGGGSGVPAAGVTATGVGGVTIGPDKIFGVGKGGAVRELVFALGGTGGALSEDVFRSGGGVSIPVFAFACESGETPGRSPLLVRTFAGGGGGTPARSPVRAFTGMTVGTEEVLRVGGATGASAAGAGVAAGVGVGDTGRSTRRNEPVVRFTCTGAAVPSAGAGRPGASMTPLFGAIVPTGSVGFFAEEAPAGARGGIMLSGGCGETGSGTGIAPACIGSGGVIGVGALTVAIGGGVTSTGGFASAIGAAGATGIGVEAVTFGSVCVNGSAGGLASWEIGSKSSSSSTFPVCTKTFAFGFVTTTRGGAVTRPEGDVAGAPVSGGAAGAAVPPLTPGALSGLRCGKSGVVFAAGGEPVSGGAAAFFGGSAVGGDEIDPDGGREIMLIGFVTAVDQAGGTLETGAGVAPGGRIAAGFIGSVVAAEIFGRGAGVVVAAGLSGRGGNAMRRVSRFGGFSSVFSDSGGLPASAMGVVFIGIPVNVQW